MNDRERFDKVRTWIRHNIVYDHVRAIQVKNLGKVKADPDRCREKKMGICLDISALAAQMLAQEGVRAKMAVGWADGTYHAWLQVVINGETELYDPTGDILGRHAKNYKFNRWRSV